MKIRSLLLGAIASSIGLGSWAGADDYWSLPDVVLTGGGTAPRHRSSGSRAHRRWRQRRASGRV